MRDRSSLSQCLSDSIFADAVISVITDDQLHMSYELLTAVKLHYGLGQEEGGGKSTLDKEFIIKAISYGSGKLFMDIHIR